MTLVRGRIQISCLTLSIKTMPRRFTHEQAQVDTDTDFRSRRFQEEASLLIADGQAEFLHDLEHVFPNAAFLAEGLVAKEVGGMIGGHERGAARGLPGA